MAGRGLRGANPIVTLRQAIAGQHDAAERHVFVCALLSGNISKHAYAEYLFNQAICYRALEEQAEANGLLKGIEELKRSDLISQDAAELGGEPRIHESTSDYVQYLPSVTPEQLWAHIYVRHFADMYGGQLIKRVAPGSCRMYEFENRAELIAKVRARLSDDLADEANRVFDFALRLFEEIADVHDIQPAALSST